MKATFVHLEKAIINIDKIHLIDLSPSSEDIELFFDKKKTDESIIVYCGSPTPRMLIEGKDDISCFLNLLRQNSVTLEKRD